MDQIAGFEPATSCLEGRNSTAELNLEGAGWAIHSLVSRRQRKSVRGPFPSAGAVGVDRRLVLGGMLAQAGVEPTVSLLALLHNVL